MRTLVPVLLIPLLLGCRSTAHPQRAEVRPPGVSAVQALLGVALYDGVAFDRADPNDPGNVVTAELSTMPALGVALQSRLAGDEIELGLDAGIVVSWDSDVARGSSSGMGSPTFFVDQSLLLGDLFVGPYASTVLADTVRVYAGAGASFMYGDAHYENDAIRAYDEAFGVGLYARGGVEMRLPQGFLGLGARWITNELDFDPVIGDVDVEGVQVYLTFTQGF